MGNTLNIRQMYNYICVSAVIYTNLKRGATTKYKGSAPWMQLTNSPSRPWVRPQNFAYWCHTGWQVLVAIFNYVRMFSLHFYMIDLANW